MFRPLTRILLSFLLVAGLLAGAIYWLIGTTSGTRTLVELASRTLASDTLQFSISQADGSLLHGIALKNINVTVEETRISLEMLTTTVSFPALLSGELRILDARLAGLDAVLGTSSSEQAGDKRAVSLPLPVILDHLEMTDMQLSSSGWSVFIAQAKAQGELEKLELSAAGRLEIDEVPAVDFQFEGLGNPNALERFELSLDREKEFVQITGGLAWLPEVLITTPLNLVANGINPATWSAAPNFQGQLDAKLNISHPAGDSAALTCSIEKLTGSFRDYPVSASGTLQLRPQFVNTDHLELISGDNRIYIHGSAGERFELAFDANISDLAALLPEAKGMIVANGTLHGTSKQPEIRLKADGSGIKAFDVSVDKLHLDADLSSLVDAEGNLILEITRMVSPQATVDKLVAKADGNLARHKAHIEADLATLPVRQVELALSGGLEQDQWNGILDQLLVSTPGAGDWKLDNPVPADIAILEGKPGSLQLGNLCMVSQQNEQVCAEGSLARDLFSLNGSTEGLRVQTLLHAANLESHASGTIDATFEASGDPASPTATLQIAPLQGSIKTGMALAGVETIPYKIETARASYAKEAGTVALTADFGQFGKARAEASLQDNVLAGQVNLLAERLEWLERFAPRHVRETRGKLALDASIAGTVEAPEVTVSGKLSDGSFKLPATAISVTEVNIDLTADTRNIRLTGSAHSGEGNIRMEGNIDPADNQVRINLTGKQFELMRKPAAHVVADPDLLYVQSPNGQRQLTGTLSIPQAEFKLRKPPDSTVTVSADEKIINGTSSQAESEAPLKAVTVDVDVRLGPQVHVAAFGLDTLLAGTVNLAKTDSNLVASGRILLESGTFKAYGQDLTIDHGALLFSGSPANPLIALEAYRESIDKSVRAIVQASGSLNNPRLRVTSIPDLPESEALAYLLTGRSLDQANAAQGNAIYAMALRSGIADPMLTNMRDRLGLDEFGLTTRQDSSTAIALGKYIQPDIYVGYSIGLFDNISEFLLRWQLSRRLELETRSGEAQSVDLYYRFEHN